MPGRQSELALPTSPEGARTCLPARLVCMKSCQQSWHSAGLSELPCSVACSARAGTWTWEVSLQRTLDAAGRGLQ